MQQLNLPAYPFKIKSENGRKQIFDEIRDKAFLNDEKLFMKILGNI